MNLRKTLSVVLSVAMLLSMMSIISFTTASAAATYTDTVLNSTSQVDLLIKPEDNLLKDAGKSGTKSGVTKACLYDGLVCLVNQEYKTGSEAWNDYAAWVTFDLGATYEVDKVMIGGCTGQYGNYEVKIFVGSADHTAISANESAYELSATYTNPGKQGGNGHLITFDQPVKGNKIVMYLGGMPANIDNNNTGRFWITELAATGTEVPEPFTYTEIKDLATYEAKGIYGDANILKTATCSKDSKVLTDDIVSGIHKAYGDDTSMAIVMSGGQNGTVKVTYTLPAKYEVTSVFVAGAGTGSYGTEALTVYDAAGNVICNYPSNVTYGLRVDFLEPAITDKLVFELKLKNNANNWQTWISEFAAAGTEVIPPYTVSNITDGVNEDKIIAPENNILKDAVSSAAGGSLPAVMYDGKLCGVSDNWGWDDPLGWCGVGASYPDKWYITWDLGADYEVDSFLLAGSGVANSKYGANNLTIYVGDKPGAEAAADEPVYSSNDLILYGRHIQLKEAAVGRYVVYEVVGYNPGSGTTNTGRVWLSEAGATGTKVIPPYTTTAVDDEAAYVEKGIYGTANILKNATITANAHGTKSTSLLVDDIATNLNEAFGSGSKCWDPCPGDTYEYVTFTLDKEYVIDSLFLAGSGVSAYGANGFSVYAGKAYGDLTDADQPIYSQATNVYMGVRVDLTEAVQTNILTFKIGTKVNAGRNQVWISELAAAGRRVDPVVTLGGQVREDDNALRFGFELIADGVAYADADPVANNNYARDIANATIVVGGKEYKLVDFGAIVSTNASSAMTLEAAEADIAGKTKAVVANNLYDVDGDAVTYTAVVTNIPEAYFDTAVYACSYVVYSDGVDTYTIYGDVINRSVNGCAADAIG